MTQKKFRALLLSTACMLGWSLSFTTALSAADIQMQVQATPSQANALSPTGKLLTIEDAVRIGLENHPRITSAYERVGSQQAVLGQQMSAYYPTILLSNMYRTGTTSGTTGI